MKKKTLRSIKIKIKKIKIEFKTKYKSKDTTKYLKAWHKYQNPWERKEKKEKKHHKKKKPCCKYKNTLSS